MNETRYLTFEIGPHCNLSAEHEWCPSHYMRPRSHGLMPVELIADCINTALRTCIEYLKHGPRIGYMPRAPFYVYRLHEGQDTASNERRAAFQADLDAYLKGEL